MGYSWPINGLDAMERGIIHRFDGPLEEALQAHSGSMSRHENYLYIRHQISCISFTKKYFQKQNQRSRETYRKNLTHSRLTENVYKHKICGILYIERHHTA